MVRTTLALLLALAGAGAHAQGIRDPPPDAGPPDTRPPPQQESPGLPDARADARGATLPRGAVLEEVSGVVREVDRKGHRIGVDAGAQRITLSLDRNTMVYTPTGLGTVLDVVPGVQIRAGRNAEFLAYWVQVRAPQAATPSTPAQGTGPGGGAAAPAIEAGAPPPGGAAGPASGPGATGTPP